MIQDRVIIGISRDRIADDRNKGEQKKMLSFWSVLFLFFSFLPLFLFLCFLFFPILLLL